MRQPSTLDSDADSTIGVLHDAAPDNKFISPERALWLSVIARAWADAFEASDHFLRASQTADERRDFDPEISRGDARRWLTLNFDPWREDRETVCDLAGIDPDIVRRAAKAKLAQIKRAEAENQEAKVIEIDLLFSRLIENEATMDPAELDAALDAIVAMEAAA